jgi:hypothetical protein
MRLDPLRGPRPVFPSAVSQRNGRTDCILKGEVDFCEITMMMLKRMM